MQALYSYQGFCGIKPFNEDKEKFIDEHRGIGGIGAGILGGSTLGGMLGGDND